jgi:photosystem II stability/assembly factor-like uncharacterized protein
MNADSRAFYDAIAFWDAKTGIAIGDPVDGQFTIIRTTDGGRTWTPVPAANIPEALPGDGAFVVSGTCLVSAGLTARVVRKRRRGPRGSIARPTRASGGLCRHAHHGWQRLFRCFSLAFSDTAHGIAVGGDYRLERESGDNLAVTNDGGKTWAFAGGTRLRSFRSAVAYVPGSKGRRLIAVGPGGSDASDDGGASWTAIGDDSFHALSVSPAGGAVWAAGEQGRIAKLH